MAGGPVARSIPSTTLRKELGYEPPRVCGACSVADACAPYREHGSVPCEAPKAHGGAVRGGFRSRLSLHKRPARLDPPYPSEFPTLSLRASSSAARCWKLSTFSSLKNASSVFFTHLGRTLSSRFVCGMPATPSRTRGCGPDQKGWQARRMQVTFCL